MPPVTPKSVAEDADAILARVKISGVYRALTGHEVKRAARGRWRAVAFWRGGDDLTVAGDDSRGVWMDFAAGEGGGILDLVVRVRGGTRQDALRWVADLAGITLERRPLSPEDRAQWAEERRVIARELPQASLWRRAFGHLMEELVDYLKTEVTPEVGEIYRTERLLRRLSRIQGAELVAEFTGWRKEDPALTTWLIAWAERQEAAEREMLKEFIHGRIGS